MDNLSKMEDFDFRDDWFVPQPEEAGSGPVDKLCCLLLNYIGITS